MTLPNTVCGVLLFDEAYITLGDFIIPYVKESSSGKYIYCTSAIQNGVFIDMIFRPEQYNGTAKCNMTVSVPSNFVKLMVSGSDEVSIGFSSLK